MIASNFTTKTKIASRLTRPIKINTCSVGKLFVLLILSGLSKQSNAISLQGDIKLRTILSTAGVTSLALNSDGTTLAAGTKTGRILVSSPSLHSIDGSDKLVWKELSRDQYAPRFPIYSLALTGSNDSAKIFAGDGDRFVSAWQRDSKSTTFQFLRTLGPHTGWVKDVAYCTHMDTLFSIGCNYIESWDCETTEMLRLTKRKIENSPDMGSTLSSDLLSLCLVEDHGLLSGGVDGRIHWWSLNQNESTPICSCRCHDGRVNAISYSKSLCLVFSSGHDGTLVVSKMDGEFLEIICAVTIEGLPRLSTLCIVDEDPSSCILALGTTCGKIVVMSIELAKDDIFIVEKKRIALDDQPMIYSICRYPLSQSSILVGHAKGLVEVRTIC